MLRALHLQTLKCNFLQVTTGANMLLSQSRLAAFKPASAPHRPAKAPVCANLRAGPCAVRRIARVQAQGDKSTQVSPSSATLCTHGCMFLLSLHRDCNVAARWAMLPVACQCSTNRQTNCYCFSHAAQQTSHRPCRLHTHQVDQSNVVLRVLNLSVIWL